MTHRLNPRQRATDAAYEGNQIADAIDEAILAQQPDDYEELAVYAHRLRICNRLDNIWTGIDLHTKDGDCFDGSGRFWVCSCKVCPHCLSKSSHRNRKKLRAIIQEQKLISGQHWHFITLTMPNQGIPLLQARHILNLAWELFRKKKWFQDTIIGGCKSEEFTLTKKGYHYHAHALVISKYISFDTFRHFWTEALRVAFQRVGRNLSVATIDGMAMANCKRVGALSEAIKEVAKYITKTSTWRKIPSADLLDICRIRRFPRMFEFFGSFRNSCRVAGDEQSEDSAIKTILDTKSISDGEDVTGWRTKVREVGADNYLLDLHERVSDSFAVRCLQLKHHYPYASFKRLKADKTDLLDAGLRRLSVLVALHIERLEDAGARPSVTVPLARGYQTQTETT